MSFFLAAVISAVRRRSPLTPDPDGIPMGPASYVFPTFTEESTIADTIKWKINDIIVRSAAASGIPGTPLNYTKTGLANYTEYTGEVVAYNEHGESSITYGAFDFITAPATPTAPTPTMVSSTEILVTGIAGDGARELYRDDVLLETLAEGEDEFEDTGLMPETEYEYKLRAFAIQPFIYGLAQPNLYSGMSAGASATTDEGPPPPTVVWDSPATMLSIPEADIVNNEGTLVNAWNLGQPDYEEYPRIIDGVHFHGIMSFGGFDSSYATGWPYGGVSYDADQVFGSCLYADGTNTADLTITGLTIGHDYLVQIVAMQPGFSVNQYFILEGVTSAAVNRGSGLSIIARFTASDTSIVLTSTCPGDVPLINAFQVRDIT